MRYDAPWDILKGHRHLATPELGRWKAAQQGHAAVPSTLTNNLNWAHEPKTTTFITTPGTEHGTRPKRPGSGVGPGGVLSKTG